MPELLTILVARSLIDETRAWKHLHYSLRVSFVQQIYFCLHVGFCSYLFAKTSLFSPSSITVVELSGISVCTTLATVPILIELIDSWIFIFLSICVQTAINVSFSWAWRTNFSDLVRATEQAITHGKNHHVPEMEQVIHLRLNAYFGRAFIERNDWKNIRWTHHIFEKKIIKTIVHCSKGYLSCHLWHKYTKKKITLKSTKIYTVLIFNALRKTLWKVRFIFNSHAKKKRNTSCIRWSFTFVWLPERFGGHQSPSPATLSHFKRWLRIAKIPVGIFFINLLSSVSFSVKSSTKLTSPLQITLLASIL